MKFYYHIPFNFERNTEYSEMASSLKFLEDNGEWFGNLMWMGFFKSGTWQFDNEVNIYDDFESKWNWLVLQAFYDGKHFKVIDNYVKRVTNGTMRVNWTIVEKLDDNGNAYIDYHYVDGDAIFDKISEIGISEWLVSEECFIETFFSGD